jgi:hypothetical protein
MTKKQQILLFLKNNPFPICDDCIAIHTQCSTRQEANQICRALSIHKEIYRHNGICNDCKRNKIVNQIGSQIPVQPIQPTIPPSNESYFSLSAIIYSWNPILSDGLEPYTFPNDITNFMKTHYRMPAIYRWSIRFDDENTLYYIGETEELCPRRLGHYIKPGPGQQTNQRLNAQFQKYLQSGCQIKLDCLIFNPYILNSIKITQKSLINANLRRMMEHLMIYQYSNQGISLLNR